MTITVSVVLHNNQRVTQLRIGVGSSCLPVAVQVNVNKTTSVIPTASVIQPIIIIINSGFGYRSANHESYKVLLGLQSC